MATRGMVRCLLAAVLFGISAPAASRLTDDLGAFVLAGLLYLGAAIAVVPVVALNHPTPQAIRAGGGRLLTAVVVGGAIGPALLATGLRSVPSATASLLLNLELVFTVILAAVVFREHLGRRVVIGSLFVMSASGLLSWSGNADARWGALLIGAACLCWGVDNCVTANLDVLAPSHITAVKGVVAGSANLVIGLVTTGTPRTASAVLAALVVGGVGYGASITLWVAGARDLGAARGQLVFATAPFVGAIVAWTLFDEPVAAREGVALAIAAVGVAFVLRSSHHHEHIHEELQHDHEHVHDDDHHDHAHDQVGDEAVGVGRHHHHHRHARRIHAHPHVPDLHHRHEHHAQ